MGRSAFLDALGQFDGRATALLGHTRWRTRGNERNNLNNHPIRAGGVVGTHNGTILNADELFGEYGLERAGEVDSEILCRMAGAAMDPDGIDPEAFLRLVAPCQGQISAVLVAEAAPGRVVVLKGNMPLEFRYSRKQRAVAYASDGRLLDDAIEAGCDTVHDWRPMVVRPMTMLVFRREEVFRPEAYRLRFVAG